MNALAPSGEEKLLAALCHASALFFPVLLPLYHSSVEQGFPLCAQPRQRSPRLSSFHDRRDICVQTALHHPDRIPAYRDRLSLLRRHHRHRRDSGLLRLGISLPHHQPMGKKIVRDLPPLSFGKRHMPDRQPSENRGKTDGQYKPAKLLREREPAPPTRERRRLSTLPALRNNSRQTTNSTRKRAVFWLSPITSNAVEVRGTRYRGRTGRPPPPG